jgi:Yeast PIR protein repeat
LSIGTDDQTGTADPDPSADPSDPPSDPPAVGQIADGQPQASQIKDGQVQAPTVTQIHDGQPQAPPSVSQISDGQPQAPAVSQISDGQPQATKVKRQAAACVSGFLTLTLNNGTLLDQDGRFAYIAGGNNQFQFDNPVQAGGYGQYSFSLCDNGTIAWNGSTDWWKCDSGAGFYNLYNAEISPDACQPCKFLALACT